jgi:hypothetical protein
MLNLNNIEIFCIDGNFTKKEILSKVFKFLNKNFSFHGIKYFSPENPEIDGVKHIQCERLNSLEDYSRYVIKSTPEYVEADYVMYIQWDGFPINPSKWNPEFLNYDFIGAPWPWKTGNDHLGMGKGFNGGFSLRSAKLVKLQKYIPTQFETWHEDAVITDICRNMFIHEGCKYAPYELAKQFSLELDLPDNSNSFDDVFGFHNKEKINTIIERISE